LTLLAPFLHGAVGQGLTQLPTGTAGLLTNRGGSDRIEAWIIDAPHSDFSRRQLAAPALSQVPLSLPSVTYSPPPIQEADISAAEGGTHPVEGASYLGHINDRIDRAWQRPKVAIGAPVFSCRVRIDQDSHGTIQQVTLEECDDNVFWRLSLLNAIQTSSPLPTPADPSLFRSTLHVLFKSTRFSRYVP
jgi:hypothetical protein